MRTQVSCLETTPSRILIVSVMPTTRTAAAEPPTTPPSTEVPSVETNDESAARDCASVMGPLRRVPHNIGLGAAPSHLATVRHQPCAIPLADHAARGLQPATGAP